MKYKKIKIFSQAGSEDEERWLNEMCQKGLALVSVKFGFFYTFEDCEPGQYIYRLQMLDKGPTADESLEYIKFLKETNIEPVDSVLMWVYFRREAKYGDFELFSDVESRLKHHQRIRKYIRSCEILVLCCTVIGISLCVDNYLHYNDWHLLPNVVVLVLSTTLVEIIACKNRRNIKKLKTELQIHE